MKSHSITFLQHAQARRISRGGIAVAVERELDIPVKFIGVGEGMDDLVEFVPEDFVDALLGT